MKHKKTNQPKNNNPFDDFSQEIQEEETELQPVSKTEIESETEQKEESSEGIEEDNNSKLQEEYDKLNNQYIRLAADFDNYRKRQAQERESLLKYGAEETMKKLIEVLDNFDRGLKAIEKIEDCQQVKDSYALVCKQMYETLNKLGLEIIEAEGQEFDPNYHEAVMQTPTSEYPENQIITQLQKGYKLGDKVLRAALVNVATSE